MIEQKPIKKEIPKQTNDNINNINLNEKYNNFDNGIVLNNPLLNEEDKAEDIFEGENNINNNINDNKMIFLNQKKMMMLKKFLGLEGTMIMTIIKIFLKFLKNQM